MIHSPAKKQSNCFVLLQNSANFYETQSTKISWDQIFYYESFKRISDLSQATSAKSESLISQQYRGSDWLIEKSSLICLKIVSLDLEKQNSFMDQMKQIANLNVDNCGLDFL